MTADQLKPNQVQRGLDFPEPVELHAKQDPAFELSIHGIEKTDETGRLCRLNHAVHGLECEIKHGGNINSDYDDPDDATGRFDFVLANPPAACKIAGTHSPETTGHAPE